MKYFIVLALLFSFTLAGAQDTRLPIKALPANDTTKPLVFYITGDGGWTGFSDAFLQSINKAGYPVLALNARKYFWKKRTPASMTTELVQLINRNLAQWKRDSVVLIGYSFGADVTPFLYNYAGSPFTKKVSQMVLMLPYTSTDFEVHLTEMIGIASHDAYSVVNEVNKITRSILFILGTEKDQFPVQTLTNKNYKVITEGGGHHFDDKADKVAAYVLTYIK
jgi:type IV secretory pathway VirJ component